MRELQREKVHVGREEKRQHHQINLYIMCCSKYFVQMLVHMACSIRVRAEVMGLDPPWSTCTCTCRLIG